MTCSPAATISQASAARRARWVPLWDAALWHRPLAQGATPAACLLIALAVLAPHPLSLGGWRNDRIDLAGLRVVGLPRHPFPAVPVLRAAGHLPADGDLAPFGSA